MIPSEVMLAQIKKFIMLKRENIKLERESMMRKYGQMFFYENNEGSIYNR